MITASFPAADSSISAHNNTSPTLGEEGRKGQDFPQDCFDIKKHPQSRKEKKKNVVGQKGSVLSSDCL